MYVPAISGMRIWGVLLVGRKERFSLLYIKMLSVKIGETV